LEKVNLSEQKKILAGKKFLISKNRFATKIYENRSVFITVLNITLWQFLMNSSRSSITSNECSPGPAKSLHHHHNEPDLHFKKKKLSISKIPYSNLQKIQIKKRKID
jgi:hypothetical protein